jgi:hypothetical protein
MSVLVFSLPEKREYGTVIMRYLRRVYCGEKLWTLNRLVNTFNELASI